MRSQIEKSKRRRKLHGKKKYIIAAILLLLGVPALYFGYALLIQYFSPLYVSPLPFVPDVRVDARTDHDTVKNTIAKELAKQRIKFTRIDTSEQNSYSIELPEGQLVLVAKNRDISIQIASLQVIYNRLTMEGKRFKRLDLRFERPVIEF